MITSTFTVDEVIDINWAKFMQRFKKINDACIEMNVPEWDNLEN